MRLVVHGQQAFGKAVLERLLERDENIVAVCTAPDKEGKPMDPVKELALEKGLAVHQPASWKMPETLELMQSFEADVCIMAYVLLFIPQPVLDAPRFGSFQYHPSMLPMHRGPSSINWPIAMGATRTGLWVSRADSVVNLCSRFLPINLSLDFSKPGLVATLIQVLYPSGSSTCFDQIERFYHRIDTHREQFVEVDITQCFIRPDITFFLD